MKGFTKDGKFHPITDYKKGVRKLRDQSTKSEGVKIERKKRNHSFKIGDVVEYWDDEKGKITYIRYDYKTQKPLQYKINGKFVQPDSIRKKLDDDSFVVLWDVASGSGRGKYDPSWRTGGKADWIEPKKVYRIIKELDEQGMVKIRPTKQYLDYSAGTPNEAPDPTYYAELTPQGLEYFNKQKEMGRTENLPRHNPLIKYHDEYSYMSPEERVANMQELMSKGLANKYNLKESAKYLIKDKIMTKSGKVLNREKALEYFK